MCVCILHAIHASRPRPPSLLRGKAPQHWVLNESCRSVALCATILSLELESRALAFCGHRQRKSSHSGRFEGRQTPTYAGQRLNADSAEDLSFQWHGNRPHGIDNLNGVARSTIQDWEVRQAAEHSHNQETIEYQADLSLGPPSIAAGKVQLSSNLSAYNAGSALLAARTRFANGRRHDHAGRLLNAQDLRLWVYYAWWPT